MSGKTMKVYHHNRMIMEIEEHLEKLQNRFSKINPELDSIDKWHTDPCCNRIRLVLGLGNVEKEQQK